MKKEDRKSKTLNVYSNNLDKIILILAFVPIVFAGLFQGGYFEWETWLTFLLSLPSIFLFIYKKWVQGEEVLGIGKDWIVLLFVLLVFVSLFFSVYFFVSLTEFYKILLYVFLLYIAINTVREEKTFKFALYFILSLSFLMSLLGLLAYIGFKFGLKGFIFDFVNFYGFASGGLVASTLQYSNTFGAFIILPTFISLGLLFYEKSLLKKIIYSLLLVAFLITILLSQSRGALLVFVLSLLIFVLLLKGKDRVASIFSLLVLLFVIILVASFKKDVLFPYIGTLVYKIRLIFNFIRTGTYDISLGGRVYMIKDSLKIFRDRPIFGTGLGTYQYVYAKYRSIYFFSKFPHSILFQYLPEGGIILTLSFLLVLGFLFYKGFKVLKENYNPINVSLFVGALGVVLHSFIDFDWSLMFIPMVVFFSLGILLSQGKLEVLNFTFIIKLAKRENRQKLPQRVDKAVQRANRILGFVVILIVIFILLFLPFLSSNINRLTLANEGKVPVEQTISNFESAIIFNPLNAKNYYDLSSYYAMVLGSQTNPNQDYFNAAVSGYKTAIQRCPELFLYHYDLGKLLYRFSNKDAISELQKTITLNPLDPGAHASLAIAYIKLENNLTKAKEELDRSLALGKEAISQGLIGEDILTDTYIGYGLYYEKLDDLENAIANYKLAISVSPKNSYALYKAGTLEIQKGDLPQGIQHLFFAVYYNPNDSVARQEFEKYAPIILIGNPRSGATYKKGADLEIQFVPSNFNNVEQYVIWLIPPSGDWIKVADNLSPNSLTYKYTIPKDIISGQYTLRIYVVSNKIMRGQLGNWIAFGEVKFNIED